MIKKLFLALLLIPMLAYGAGQSVVVSNFANRINVQYYAVNATAGATTIETPIALSQSRGLQPVVTPLANVATPTVTTVGTTGAVAWGYKIVAKTADGTVTAASTAGTTAGSNGNATLTTANLQRVTWTTVAGAVSYDIYRTTSGGTPASLGKIGSATVGTFDDTGIVGDATTAPSVNTTGTSFIIPAGKHFRITNISVATRGNAVATAQATTFSLRLNTAGVVTITSTPVVFQGGSATAAVAQAWDRYEFSIPSEGYEILGDGTLQFGVTGNATFTTNAPTWYVNIVGFEY